MTTRRDVLSGLGAALAVAPLAAPRVARANARMAIISHAVHKGVATTGKGGDIAGQWATANNANVEWLTFGIEAANERALREATLSQSSVDVVFLLDRYMAPQYATLFEDLREWQAKEPIADFGEIPPGMLAAHTFGGKLTGLPYRHATHGLHYNEALFEERNIAGPPKTVADLPAVAAKLTFDRADGSKVYGLFTNMDDPATPIDWIRGHGGDLITPDYKVVIDSPASVRGVAMLVDLVQQGILPRNVMTTKNEDTNTFMQQGRAAMTNNPFGRFTVYNDPKASKYPGKIRPVSLPLGMDGKPIPAKTSVWAMGIPRNAPDKALSWSLIRHMSTPENTVRAALNGNGPVRPSAYQDSRVQQLIPYAQAERDALATARLVVPGFPNAARAMDVFMEELGLALLGRKSAGEAMAAVRSRVEPMLPA